MNISQMVAVDMCGEITIHLPDNSPNDYATVCGLDGVGDCGDHKSQLADGGSIVPLPKGATKVTCSTCYFIYMRWRELAPRIDQFDEEIRRAYV